MKIEILIGILVGFLLGNSAFLIHFFILEPISLFAYFMYVTLYGLLGLIIGFYIGFIVLLTKKGKGVILNYLIFSLVTLYLLIGFFLYLNLSINSYRSNDEQYDSFVKCLNNQSITEQEISSCNQYKSWENFDLKRTVQIGKMPYSLLVSGFFEPQIIILWPIRFFIQT
jgi:uncharacterized protein YacL